MKNISIKTLVFFASAMASICTPTSFGQTITTYAGTGSMGYSGDGGQATAADLHAPYGLAVGSNGQVVFVDGGSVVRQISGAGVITTIAGSSGVYNYGGDGTTASAAIFNAPLDIAIDASDNIYISDLVNCIVRKIDASTGFISTVAGIVPGTSPYSTNCGFTSDASTVATNSALDYPGAIAVDGSGNLYIADMNNRRIRKVSGGNMVTIAGQAGGAAGYNELGHASAMKFRSMRGLAVDGSGNIYVSDDGVGSRRVRKIDASSMNISRLAGTGIAGFDGDGRPATSAKLDAPDLIEYYSGAIYIADRNEDVVRKVDLSTGIISTVAGSDFTGFSGDGGFANCAEMSFARGVTVDQSNGNIYISDATNNRIRRVIAKNPPPVLPSNSDNTLFTNGHTPVTGLNTASIAYGTSEIIFATVYYDGSGTCTLHVKDPSVGTATITVTGVDGVPDVIIGNSTGMSPTTDYVVGVAYPKAGGSGNDVVVEFFDVYDDGSSTITVASSSTSPIVITSCNAAVVHMDLLPDGSNTGPTGRPFCDRFFLTWDDNISPPYVVWAADADLNTGTLGTPAQITDGSTYFGKAPDIAAVIRNVSSSDHEFALITYTGTSSTDLFLAAWDFTADPTASSVTPILLDDVSGILSGAISKPRIAAEPNVTYPNISNVPDYKVVAEVFNGSKNEIRTYDNTTIAYAPEYFTCSNVIDISGVPGYGTYTPSYNNYSPCVALGSFGAPPHYIVAHYMSYSFGDIYFKEPILTLKPDQIACDYYWVNSRSGTPTDASASSYANAIAVPDNEESLNCTYAWAFYNGSNYEVDYKITDPSFAFKPAPQTSGEIQNSLSVFPNPVSYELTIGGIAVGNARCEYKVMNMLGQLVLSGEVKSGKTKVDVANLAGGNYMVSVYKNGERAGSSVFVKE